MWNSSSTYMAAAILILSLSAMNMMIPSRSEPSPVYEGRGKCHKEDKKALESINATLSKPNGPPFDQTWQKNVDCCKWRSVECDDNTGRVIGLDLFGSDVSFQIPSAFGDLRYLQSLTFHKLPNLTGTIPSAITKLVHLDFLRISWTNLSGPVPSFLSQLKNLTYLNLSFNNLTGTIPPSLSDLRKLEFLRLDRNKLTGSIPESFGNWAGGPTIDLFLSHNNLTGPVPKSLGNLNFTNSLDLSRNKLEGDPSFLFGKSKSVLFVYLSRNKFEFDLSKVAFPENLVHLDLNHNKIFGSLPRVMTQFEWQLLNVSYNRLCGEIPQGGRMQSFDLYSYFHNRCLCGAPLPPCSN